MSDRGGATSLIRLLSLSRVTPFSRAFISRCACSAVALGLGTEELIAPFTLAADSSAVLDEDVELLESGAVAEELLFASSALEDDREVEL